MNRSLPLGDKRVLSIQFGNPGAYPPAVYSSHLLAEAGAQVRFIGRDDAPTRNITFPHHDSIALELRRITGSSARLKLSYLRWLAYCSTTMVSWRPDVVYLHDHMTAPLGYLARVLGLLTIYHEHDCPGHPETRKSLPDRLLASARSFLAKEASLCVLPGEERIALFRAATNATAPLVSVRNCPRTGLVAPSQTRASPEDTSLVVHYHGSLSPARLPFSVIDALGFLPPDVSFQFAGYEAPGSPGHLADLLQRASAHGVDDRVQYLGVLPHTQLQTALARADVGLLLLRPEQSDHNSQTLAGASNKFYEYVAGGLPVLVSRDSSLAEVVTQAGAGIVCDGNRPESIAAALTTLSRPALRAAIGSRSRARYKERWNYEAQFLPVISFLALNTSSFNA